MRPTKVLPTATAADSPLRELDAWRPDLLSGFECRDIPLDAEPLPGEPDDPLVATLIRRSDARARHSARAVLYVHGWNDYFFHTHVADFYEAQGFAFYALDLRRYGRSTREGQFRGFIESLDDYAQELDAAVDLITAAHPRLVVTGHSTGGLIASLYVAHHPGQVGGLVLNSPWLDMFGPPAIAKVLRPVLGEWSRRKSTGVLPLPESTDPVYAKAMHASYGGEWDYSLVMKSAGSEPIRAGWLRAILAGHEEVSRGLGIDCPVIVLTAQQTKWLRRYSEAAKEADIVLDVDKIRAAAPNLGSRVTLVRIDGGTHDLSLSPEPARTRYFREIAMWLRGYVPEKADPPMPSRRRAVEEGLEGFPWPAG